MQVSFAGARRAAVSAIQAAQKIVLTTHINPDGDGLGAALALQLGLRRLGKQVRFLVPSTVASLYDFLPGIGKLRVLDDSQRARRVAGCDLMISCDCSDQERLGACATIRHRSLLNIDHHASNDRFGDLHLIDERAASTGIVVMDLLHRLGLSLDPDMATCLYTTIVFDTGRFMHGNTTAAVLRSAARLLDCGIDAAAINRSLSYNKSPIDLAVQRLGLECLRIDRREPRLAGIALSASAIAALGAVDDWGDLVDIPRSLQGVEVAYLMREQPSCAEVRVSLRANPPYQVGPLATALGGGGHMQAAGCTVAGSLSQVQGRILKALRAILREA